MVSKRCIVVLSGKRKSGKDYIAGLLQEKLSNLKCSILRLSYPLKRQYAEEHDLDLEKLLDSSPYKELYREDMIKWGEEKRNKDPYTFIRAVTNLPEAEKPVWIISDARRISDITCLKSLYPNSVIVARIEAGNDTRAQRGWKFVAGVDDTESECGLDDFLDFDLYIDNNDRELAKGVDKLLAKINMRIS